VILRRALVAAICAAGMLPSLPPVIAQAPAVSGLHAPLDQLLELYVRDGLVYYNAVKSDRRRLDAYIAALNGPQARAIDQAPNDEQIAFWLNAYNALVVQTVVDNYPIKGRASNYPPNSVRQIPGAFDKMPHSVAGRSLTLDQIETKVLAGFRDPRLYLAIGRGAVGGGRLRSEAYNGATLGQQLAAVATEFATGGQLLDIDESTGGLRVRGCSPLCRAQPDREGAPSVHPSQHASARARVPGAKPVPRAVRAVRLALERSDWWETVKDSS
jgi:Protein of unknown function, DUF547